MINFRNRRVSLVIIICEGPRGKMGASDDVALHYPIFSKFALIWHTCTDWLMCQNCNPYLCYVYITREKMSQNMCLHNACYND